MVKALPDTQADLITVHGMGFQEYVSTRQTDTFKKGDVPSAHPLIS